MTTSVPQYTSPRELLFQLHKDLVVVIRNPDPPTVGEIDALLLRCKNGVELCKQLYNMNPNHFTAENLHKVSKAFEQFEIASKNLKNR